MTETGNKLLDGLYSLTKAPEFIKRKAKEYLLTLIGPITSTTSSGIEEAPIDGTQYGREDGAWTEIVTGGFSGTMDDITDGSTYVKTHNDYTDAEVTKLSGIAAGAEVNVQADWNEADSGSDAYIANKPTIPTAAWTLVAKTSDETVTADTTYSADSALSFAADSGKTYIFRVNMLVIFDGDPDFKFYFGYSGTTSKVQYTVQDVQMTTSGVGNTFYAAKTAFSQAYTIAQSAGATVYYAIVTANGMFTTTASGNFEIYWAQNSSSVDTVGVLAGSTIEYKAY